MKKDFKYYAFISYKREDEPWAKWLQEKMEYFKLPVLDEKNGESERYIRPVFRDTTDLKPGLLSERIREALDKSKFLIAICSPRYSQSAWYDAEIKRFIETGKSASIIPFIVEGKPYAKDHNNCFPPSLLQLQGTNNELLGVNVQDSNKDYAFIQVVSAMLDLDVDELWNRYLKNEEIEKKKLKQQNDRLLSMQSRIVAEKARALINEYPYDPKKAAALALNVLPSSLEYPNRPWVPEAEYVLRKATTKVSHKIDFTDKGTILYSENNIAIISCYDDSSTQNNSLMRIYDLITGKKLDILYAHAECAVLSSDGEKIATMAPQSIIIWNNRNGIELCSMKCIESQNPVLLFTRDNKHLLSVSGKYIEVWDANTGNRIKLIKGHDKKIMSLKLSPDGRHFLTSSIDNKVKMWSTILFAEELTLEYDTIVECSCFSLDGSCIISFLSYEVERMLLHNYVIKRYDIIHAQGLNSINLITKEPTLCKDVFFKLESPYLFIQDSFRFDIYDIVSGIKVFDYIATNLRVSDSADSIEATIKDYKGTSSILHIDFPSREHLLEDATNSLEGFCFSEKDKNDYFLDDLVN